MAYPYELVTLDPHAHANSVTRGVLSSVCEGLIEFERGFPVRPWLADRWSNPDERTWRFHVRQGVRFHDGRPLTANDVAASIARARTSTIGGLQLQQIESVQVDPEDSAMVVVTTSRPSPLLLTRLESVGIVPADFDPRRPVGTGPYVWQMGSEEGPIRLRRFAAYWKTPPDFEEVVIEFVPSSMVTDETFAGDALDVMTSIDVGFVRAHETPAGWKVLASPAITTAFLGMNVSRPPLTNPDIRRAVFQAIDRRKLVATVFPEGTARPAWSIVPHDIVGFTPELRREDFDRDRAASVIRSTGADESRPLELAYSSERGNEAAEAVAAALGAVGLDVRPVGYDYEGFYAGMQSDDSFDLFLFNWTFRVADASRFFDLLVHSRDVQRSMGIFNATSLKDDVLDLLIEDAVLEPQLSDRINGLQRALVAADEASVYMALYRPSNLSLVRSHFVVGDFSCSSMRPQDVRLLRQ
jgi:peptide/nickel transport system substrate-binding protein